MKRAECDRFHGWEVEPRHLLRCAHWGYEAVVMAGAGGWVYEIAIHGVGGHAAWKVAGLPEAVAMFEAEETKMGLRHFN